MVSNTPGNPAQVTLEVTGSAEGVYTITLTATDDDVNPETTVRTLTVNVIDCNCSAPPVLSCAPTTTVNATAGDCEAFVALAQPGMTLPCLSEGALSFAQANAYVELSEDPISEGDFSIEFWFKPEATTWSGVLYDMSESNRLTEMHSDAFTSMETKTNCVLV